MKYRLLTYEHNGHDDSDFFVVLFNAETGTFEREMYASTRFGGAANPRDYPEAPDELLPAIRDAFAKRIFDDLRASENRRVTEPDSVGKGTRVRLLAPVRFRDKRSGQVIKAEAGEAGTVIWCGAFGTFFRNGYKRVGRSTLRVGVALGPDDVNLSSKRVVFCDLSKVRLDIEPASDSELRAKAASLAQVAHVGSLFAHYAWATEDWIAPRLRALAPVEAAA